MRVALLSCNGQARNAIGNQLAAKVALFQERGAETRVFLEDERRLHPGLRSVVNSLREARREGAAWNYLADADLVVADYAQYYELLHYLPLLFGGKPRLLFDYHGVTPAELCQGPQRALQERSARERGFVWCAHAALAHSQFAKDELQKATGYPTDRIRVVSYPTDLAQFSPGDGTSWRQRHRLDSSPILLYVGRFAPSKRVPVLLEALTELQGAQAVLIGADDDVYALELQRCRDLARQIGVAERVHFLGSVDERDLAEAYRAADVLVIPSAHEGYCLPAIEAMASGVPVVAARTTALPETMGDAGLTFTADDPRDLARQVRRVLSAPGAAKEIRSDRRRVAVVCFRFGGAIVGGAETSLRTMARALQRGGHYVEVFTTCTAHESAWANELAAGTFEQDGLTVHRFPIDPHDRTAHHEAFRRIVESDVRGDSATEQAYLRHSIHSSSLIAALCRRQAEFDAILAGPYLFGLTHDVARALPDKTLLVPCFHDEPLARLACWRDTYAAVGGILYHSPEEQDYAQQTLGINHPRGVEVGTWIEHSFSRDAQRSADAHAPLRVAAKRREIVYCGRYSAQKNLPLLFEFAERYEHERPGRFQFVFAGQGETSIPDAAWASNRGRVTEEDKRCLLAHAAAVVQLSRQESLSLIVLEGWAQGTPAIVHAECAVLRAQVARARGGRAIADYQEFARALDDLWDRPEAWRTLGANGRNYVEARYASEDAFRRRLLDALDSLHTPLQDVMRVRGLQRAAQRSPVQWGRSFDAVVDQILHEPAPVPRWSLDVAPQTPRCRAAVGQRSLLIPVRVANAGDMAAVATGPARSRLAAEIVEHATGKIAAPCTYTDLPGLVAPGRAIPAALLLAPPARSGAYDVMLWAESDHGEAQCSSVQTVHLVVADALVRGDESCPADAVRQIQEALAEVHRLQRLPSDYIDVTEGRFARWKRWLKQKLLGNFKKAYVDVLSQQQSQVNQSLLLAVQRLADYCATLEHALQSLAPNRGSNNGNPADDTEEPMPTQGATSS